MKNIRKFTPFPYGVINKHSHTSWRFLNKFTPNQKSKFKQKNRLFSLELGRSLPKRVIWQTALAKNANLGNIINNHNKPITLKLNPNYSWRVFTSAFFGKIWLLNNPSAVPGIAWPTKSKKILLAKIKAFKALSLSAGKLKTAFIIKNLQKFYKNSFSVQSISTLWHMAGSFDCLKNTFFYKLGFFASVQSAFHKTRSNTVLFNGFSNNQSLNFVYPGDFVTITEKSIFTELFSFGKKTNYSSIYTVKPFLWLSTFYKPMSKYNKQKVYNKKSIFLKKKNIYSSNK